MHNFILIQRQTASTYWLLVMTPTLRGNLLWYQIYISLDGQLKYYHSSFTPTRASTVENDWNDFGACKAPCKPDETSKLHVYKTERGLVFRTSTGELLCVKKRRFLPATMAIWTLGAVVSYQYDHLEYGPRTTADDSVYFYFEPENPLIQGRRTNVHLGLHIIFIRSNLICIVPIMKCIIGGMALIYLCL